MANLALTANIAFNMFALDMLLILIGQELGIMIGAGTGNLQI